MHTTDVQLFDADEAFHPIALDQYECEGIIRALHIHAIKAWIGYDMTLLCRDFALSQRAVNGIKRNHVKTMKDLLFWHFRDYATMVGCGRRTTDEYRAMVEWAGC